MILLEVMLTLLLVEVMSIVGTFALFYFFRRAGEGNHRSTVAMIGFIIGVIFNLMFLYWAF